MRRMAAVALLWAPAFLVPRVNRVARGRTARAAAAEGEFGGLALWLLEHGAEVHGQAAVRDGAGGRGIWSSGALEEGAEVARIPYQLLLTKVSAEKALPEVSGVAEYPSIALQLIHEKYALGPRSFWSAYLEHLPSLEDIGASFTWSEAELELLDGSLIRNMSCFLREKIEEEYNGLMASLPPTTFPADVFTLQRFLWAYAVLLSRSFRLRFGPQEVIALVPWIDFMNHDPDSKAYVAGSMTGRERVVILKTDRAYAPQEQIFDSYGRRSNDELLLLYGFSLPRNVHNFVELSLLELWKDTTQAPTKKKWLKAQGADVDEMQSLCLPRGYWPPETMLLMRLLVLSEQDLPKDKAPLQGLADLGLKNAFNAAVERRALEALRRLCAEALLGPARHKSADAAALAAPKGSRKERYAVMTRAGEVNVLETNLHRIDRLLEQIPFVFEMQEARRKQRFPGLAADAKPQDFDLFLQEFALDD